MMVSASMDSDPVYMIWPIFKWLFLVSFHLFPLQNNFFPPKRNSPALTTWTYSSAQAPTCFVLTVDCRVSPFSNSTCLQSLLCDKTPPSKFEGEMQEIIWLCRYLQIHLMASITRFLNICWGKGWKMLVLAVTDSARHLKGVIQADLMTPGPPRLDCVWWELKKCSYVGLQPRKWIMNPKHQFVLLRSCKQFITDVFLPHLLHGACASFSFHFGLVENSWGKVVALQQQRFSSHASMKLLLCSVYFYIRFVLISRQS